MLYVYTILKGPWLSMRMDDFNGAIINVLAAIKAAEAKWRRKLPFYRSHMCSTKWWVLIWCFCSTVCTVSVIINSLQARTIISPSYLPLAPCMCQIWIRGANYWGNYKQIQAEKKVLLVSCNCKDSLCCSACTISYDLLIVLLVMRNAFACFIALHKGGLIKHPDSWHNATPGRALW